jgi:hypothetical protein
MQWKISQWRRIGIRSLDLIGIAQAKFRQAIQKSAAFVAIDLVSEEVTRERLRLHSKLARSADNDAILRKMLQEIVWIVFLFRRHDGVE